MDLGVNQEQVSEKTELLLLTTAALSLLGASGKKVEVSLRTFTKLSKVLPLDTAPLLNKFSLWNKPNMHLTNPTALAGQSKKGE